MHLAAERLVYLLDGTLQRGEQEELARHVAGCGECRERLADCRVALASLGRAATIAPPVGLVPRIAARVRTERRRRTRRRAALAATLVAALTGFWWARAPEEPARTRSLADYIAAIEAARDRGADALAHRPAGFEPLALDEGDPLVQRAAELGLARELDGYGLRSAAVDRAAGVLQLHYAGEPGSVCVFLGSAAVSPTFGSIGRAEHALALPELGPSGGYVLTPSFQLAQVVVDRVPIYIVGAPGDPVPFGRALVAASGRDPD
jgi:hypothetical protein